MRYIVILTLFIPLLSWANVPDECIDEKMGVEAYNFSSEIIEVFQNKDLAKLSDMTETLYGNGHINYFNLSNLKMTDVFDDNMINDLLSKAEPVCTRFSYEGYSFGWGIWFEFLNYYDENCQNIVLPKIISLNEGVKEKFQIAAEDMIIKKEIKFDNTFKCEQPVLSMIIKKESLEMPSFDCVYNRFKEYDVVSGGEVSDAIWECTSIINKQRIDEILIEDSRAFDRYDFSENLNKYFSKN